MLTDREIIIERLIVIKKKIYQATHKPLHITHGGPKCSRTLGNSPKLPYRQSVPGLGRIFCVFSLYMVFRPFTVTFFPVFVSLVKNQAVVPL